MLDISMAEPHKTLSSFLQSCLEAAPERDATGYVGDWFAFRTHIGLVRLENQDRVAVARWLCRGEPVWVAVVADGIGSGKAGSEAAAMAVATFISFLVTTLPGTQEHRLAEAVEKANQALHVRWRGKEGTTLSALLVCGGQASLVNVGDSRIYGIKADDSVELLTRDDVLPAHAGLLQFVGMGLDLIPHALPVPAEITRLLLTSDGAHSFTEPVLPLLVRAARTDLRLLVDRVTHLSNWCGGVDNTTCLVALINSGRTAFRSSDPVIDLWTPGVHHRMPWEVPVGSAKPRKSGSSSRKGSAPVVQESFHSRELEIGRPPRAPKPAATIVFDYEPNPPAALGPPKDEKS